MKNIILWISFFAFFAGNIGESLAQIQYPCPTSIGYTTVCPQSGSGFFMFASTLNPQITSAVLDLEGVDPHCNGNITLTQNSCNLVGYFYTDNITPYCQLENPTGTVTFNTGLECAYIDGDLVPCNDLVTACKQPLIEFAQEFISDPPNCKLWEGPCATESEIWRTGDVKIGAISSLDGFKLGVQGGITTEMLQICKAEWCDYVFSDTFHLMPLEVVDTYIQKNGHLPNCTPAAKILEERGFLLAEETVTQQEKIEEIFLHLIEAEKRLGKLDKRLSGVAPNVDLLEISRPSYLAEEFPQKDNILLQIECFQIKSAPGGIGGVRVTPNTGPYTLTWSGAGSGSIPNMPCADGAIQIQNLVAGTYTVTVSNSSGNLGTCSFSISSGNPAAKCDVLGNPLCKEAIVQMLESEAFGTPPNCEQWEGDPCSHEDRIHRLGNVGIGTSVGRAGYSLAVKGGIVTDKFRVELCESQGLGWCDYVFDDGYPLLSLTEVETFIKTHKHLPGTVSQNEVTENGGFEMRSVKLDQQKKIEEAYLHLIALNKQKDVLKQKLSALSFNN